MDHDVLTANDFAGEAFLALGTIPGVADYNTSVDNFHGLKQVELPLMQQTERSKFSIDSTDISDGIKILFSCEPFQIIQFCKFSNRGLVISKLLTLFGSRELVS